MKENDKNKGVSKEEFDNNLKKLIFNVPPPDKDKRHKKVEYRYLFRIRIAEKDGPLLANWADGQSKVYEIIQHAPLGIGMGKQIDIEGVNYTIVGFEIGRFLPSKDQNIHEADFELYVKKS